MVSRKINQRTALISFAVAVVLAFFVTALLVGPMPNKVPNGSEEVANCPSLDGTMVADDCVPEIQPIKVVDFQPMVDAWVDSVSGDTGVIVYDLDADMVVGEHKASQKFRIESIYKLFVVYEGYRRVQNGTWGDDKLECLDLAIRESNSACAESLWAAIGRETLDGIVQTDFGLPEVTVGSITATPTEVMKMMRIFYEHTEITDEKLVERMQDSFLNQPATTYDWRRGLPSGFSDKVEVYNKVGWLATGSGWLYYDDAAIVKFLEAERNYIVVVLTTRVDNKAVARFGTEFEEYFFSKY